MPEQPVEILETWDGPVYDPDADLFYGEMLTADDTEQEFLVPCEEERVQELSYDTVIENYLESLECDMDDSRVEGKNELAAAIEIFNRANDGLKMYSQIEGKLVRVQHLDY